MPDAVYVLLERREVRRLLRRTGDDNANQTAAEFWYTTSNVSLSEEEVRETHENVAGFFGILQEWDTKEQGVAGAANCSVHAGSLQHED